MNPEMELMVELSYFQGKFTQYINELKHQREYTSLIEKSEIIDFLETYIDRVDDIRERY